MRTKKYNLQIPFALLLILFAAFSRIVPHPFGVAPIGAMALFGSAYFSKQYFSFTIPIISMWLSDLVINNVVYGHFFDHFVWFYQGFYWTYGAFIGIGIMGHFLLKQIKIKNLLLASILSSFIFFMVSNFGVWFSASMYPKNITGFISCFIAGIPFFKNTLMGDLVYTGVLFGIFEFVNSGFIIFKPQYNKA